MTKILVTYLSQTGNTKKIAEAIFEDLEGDKTIKPMDEVQKIEGYSL
nr:flavodoxin [bacterium]